MAPFTIKDEEFQSMKGKVVVITGGSSGIGLATAQLLRQQQAFVVIGDRQPPSSPEELPGYGDAVTFVQADVTSWAEMTKLFESAVDKYGKIDHVFANAGTTSRDNYITADVLDDNGELKEPDHTVLCVNLIGVVNTVKLAIHHLRKQMSGTSIVITASAAAYQPLSSVDYCAAKHGVLGLMRGLNGHLHPHLPIRINSIAPSWTETGLISADLCKYAGIDLQTPAVVARSVVQLMVDSTRNQQLIYSCGGRFAEIEADLLAAADSIRLKETSEEQDYQRMLQIVANLPPEARPT